jgi:hypothetical protein
MFNFKVLDGWTSSNYHSYFFFVIITPERKEYVIKVKDYTKKLYTGLFTAQEIKKILIYIGPEHFSSVVSNGASAMQLAKQLISDEYPRIIPVCCI